MALVKCKECGNEISTDARACPRCGKVQRPFPTLRVALLLVLVAAIAWGVAMVRKFEEQSSAASRAVSDDLGRPNPAPPLTPENHAAARAKLAYDVWSKFDRLPDSMRTLPMVKAHLLQAVQFADGVDEPWAKQIRTGSEANARMRVALLLNGNTDPGEAHDVFVLAPDAKACERRKPQFEPSTANAEILKSWAFKSLRCPGTGEVAYTTWDLR